ncbi:MAG: hypothetical protein AB1468_03370 [Candidatus Micrarchaeota archaeon]
MFALRSKRDIAIHASSARFPEPLSDELIKPKKHKTRLALRIATFATAVWLAVTGIGNAGGSFHIMTLDWEKGETKLLRGTDKMQHVLLTSTMTEYGARLFEKIGAPHPRALASTLALTAGLGIEAYDGTNNYKKNGGASISDFIANIVGVIQANLKMKSNGSFEYGFAQRFEKGKLEHNPAMCWTSFRVGEFRAHPVWLTFSFSNYDKEKDGPNNPNIPNTKRNEKLVGTRDGNFNVTFSLRGF